MTKTKTLDPAALYEKAVEYILRMPKTERQVRMWFAKKTMDKNLIDELIEKLKDYNFINDEDYAAAFVSCKKEKLGVGVIRNKLIVNGVKGGFIEKAMTQVENQYDLAISKAEKYMASKDKTLENKSKLFRYMLAKGFDFELCGEVVNEYWNRY